ncbi:MAG: 23S rRNA (uracil(1939)-C(5))-methyltransferase RlmD [Lunatimonas sp.]|uniref:23S rRNA (uracil(1939)-C(5))-methyltransferase RlmD n=1 Tax=Lunatimonas sp. TaxID=2060141 RepID=UPI00263A6841|nr:23S rRNA (uracil(1939)-C(5))-methyltransferase RlmD [Lunatimonas sp.]MCC5939108.1 23S rRNA (uracil(1939)-C(5))-methyltransferase RlmD [Lunatimonas sp.]
MSRKMKNQVLKGLTIERIAAEGKCVAHYEGKVVFVPQVAPGDIVDVRVTKGRNSYLEGEAIHIQHYSPDRSEPFCSHFGVCGGCKWQHISYPLQLSYKRQQVIDQFQRIAKVPIPDVLPIIGASESTYYRNKLDFTFSSNRWLTSEEIASGEEFERYALGFHVPKRFDKIVDIDHCYLQGGISNEVRNKLRDYALEKEFSFYDLIQQQGLLRNLIIRNTLSGQTMVIVQFGEENPEAIREVMTFLQEEFPEITSLLYIINQKKNETFHDLEVHTFAGKPYIEEEMEGLTFRVGPKSFYQTNPAQAHRLYEVAREFAGLSGDEIVYDLYTGTGTIANFVARKAKQVIGIEYVEEAIADAKINAAENGLTNTLFYGGDMKDLLTADFMERHAAPDVVITDPPRAGMHNDVIQTLLQLAAPKIVYVSCNPATQARDVALLSEKYDVRAVQPVDMFPQTYHVENVVLLTKKPNL